MLDQVLRFAPVVALVHELPPGSLLDVGSGSVGIAPWIGREWRVTGLDASFDDYGSAAGPAADGVVRIEGDARELPFDDASFDVVLALDVLEHIAPTDRGAVLGELARVARRRAIVCCPTGADALAADQRLAEHYAALGAPPPGWIHEHLEHGFPDADDLRQGLADAGSVRLIDNEHVPAHERVMRAQSRRSTGYVTSALERLLGAGVRSRGFVATASQATVRAIRGRDRRPSYRTIAVLDK
jgi:SAM-dependent methyltransferase